MYQSVDEEQAPNPADVVIIEEDRKSMPMHRALKERTMRTLTDISIQEKQICTHVYKQMHGVHSQMAASSQHFVQTRSSIIIHCSANCSSSHI